MTTLSLRQHWVFDLDGTLTIAAHDFDAIRRALGLPPGEPILEALAQLPTREASALRVRLDAIEREIAASAEPADGAAELLTLLADRGAHLGILTRNSHANALATLAACGLDAWFGRESIIDRDAAPPKPDPAGVHALIGRWRAEATSTVVVGDYLFDLLAGRAAGAATVYVDPAGGFPFAAHADLAVKSLREIVRHVGTAAAVHQGTRKKPVPGFSRR